MHRVRGERALLVHYGNARRVGAQLIPPDTHAPAACIDGVAQDESFVVCETAIGDPLGPDLLPPPADAAWFRLRNAFGAPGASQCATGTAIAAKSDDPTGLAVDMQAERSKRAPYAGPTSHAGAPAGGSRAPSRIRRDGLWLIHWQDEHLLRRIAPGEHPGSIECADARPPIVHVSMVV